MIHKNDIKDNSLEEVLMKQLDTVPKVPLSEENMHALMLLTLNQSNEHAIEKIYDDLKKKSWQLQAIEKRVELLLTVEIPKIILIWLTLVTDSNIGKMVVYTYYLQYWAKKNNITHITWNNLHENIFPTGYFEEEGFLKAWDNQKIKKENSEDSDNLIDYSLAAKSIQF